MNRNDAIDLGLVLSTTVYALWLDGHKHQEPDWTWLEVVGGVSAVLAAAGLRSRCQTNPTWRDHEHNVWRAFALGGMPIICGEVSQALRAWRDRDAYIKRQWEREGYDGTPTLAGRGRAAPPRRG